MKDWMPVCAKACMKEKDSCSQKECKNWIEYDQDLNCSLVAIHKYDYENGTMPLREIAKRTGVSYVMIHHILNKALKKVRKETLKKI